MYQQETAAVALRPAMQHAQCSSDCNTIT